MTCLIAFGVVSVLFIAALLVIAHLLDERKRLRERLIGQITKPYFKLYP